jgi:hypothetical protein
VDLHDRTGQTSKPAKKTDKNKPTPHPLATVGNHQRERRGRARDLKKERKEGRNRQPNPYFHPLKFKEE